VVNDNPGLNLGATLYYWNGTGNYAVAPYMEPGKSYFAWIGTAGELLISHSTVGFARFGVNSSMQRLDSKSIVGSTVGPTTGSMNRQPPPPTAPGAFIRITSPNGNETWMAGEQRQITWNSLGISPEGLAGTVDIAFSRDGGSTYEVVIKQYPNSGYYNLRIPGGIVSDKCLTKITSSLYPGVSDVSDAFFGIR